MFPGYVRRQHLWDQTGDLSNGGFLVHLQRSAEFRAGAAQDVNSENSCDFGNGILINALVTGVFSASTAPNPLISRKRHFAATLFANFQL